MTSRTTWSFTAALIFLLAATPAVSAKRNVVKLATLAPDGSLWHKALKTMGNEWKEATDGRVTLRIYAGGVAGDEPAMVRMMRIGQLHGAALTVNGLYEIDPSFLSLAIPMFYDSYEELDHVTSKLQPLLEERLAAKGFILLHWGHGGWLHFFSTKPVRGPADLKRLKMFASAGDDKMVQLWKKEGYRPVALSSTDILPGLQTGMIEALPVPPLAALSLQWFRSTPYMLEEPLAPLIGGVVITKRAWKKLTPEDQALLLEAAGRAEKRLREEIPVQDKKAVAEMQERGLELTRIEAEAIPEWEKNAASFAQRIRGSLVPTDIFDLASETRDAYRRGKAPGGNP